MARTLREITEDHIQAFHRVGAICIRQFLTREEIDGLRKGVDFNLDNLSERAKVASKPDDPGLFIEDFCTWQKNPYYNQFIFESPIGALAACLMKSETARLYHDHLLVKEPFTKQSTPWHQDLPYYNVHGMQNCSFWIAIDPIPRASTLEFIAGSHLGPWFMPRTFMDHQAKWFPEGSLKELPDIESAREKYPIIGWDVEPGDLICFHMLTLHSAKGVADHRRRVFSLRFLGDDMVHAPRAWITSPHFPGLDEELPKGAPLDHPLFPLVFQC